MDAFALFLGLDLVVLVASSVVGVGLFARLHRREREAKAIAASFARTAARSGPGLQR